MTEMFSQEALSGLRQVAQAVDAAQEPKEPQGETEARLRRENPMGQLVRMANGDVVYVPVVTYHWTIYTADDEIRTAAMRKTKFQNPKLEELLDIEDAGKSPVSIDWLLKKLLCILRENYPDLKPAEAMIWTGPVSTNINDTNAVVSDIFQTFQGFKKKLTAGR